MESKLKHLEMIQAVVNRMASNSFLLKGWSVTLVSALLALAAANSDRRFVFVAVLPLLMFWLLDAYFLRQERLFRKLYDKVRNARGECDRLLNEHRAARCGNGLLDRRDVFTDAGDLLRRAGGRRHHHCIAAGFLKRLRAPSGGRTTFFKTGRGER